MSANLVCNRIRWKVEGAKLMGDMEMIRIATGERTRFMSDGSVVKDQVNPPRVEFCDACESMKSMQGGMSFNYFYDLIWICQDCRNK
jgi:hypothetical protein